jgi:signal transduction histidine kinase/ligand-binding sensor domain-containing protein
MCMVLAACAADITRAVEPATPLANYGRQSWAMESGLPQNTVQALAQTRDGFVWAGTEAGLVRFDGVSFTVFDRNSTPALPGNDVRCLLETADGALWIGTSDGMARWKDGAVMLFSTREGLPANGIRALTQDSDGALLAWTDGGAARLDGQRFDAAQDNSGAGRKAAWRDAAARAGVSEDTVENVVALAEGEMAVATHSALIVVRGASIVQRFLTGTELPGSRIQAVFADREGSLWIGTNSGLARLAEGKLQLLPATDPLARASVLALMEDREGDLWVGTETDGLHILRDQRFRVIGTREGLTSDDTTAVVQDGSGALWVGTADNGLNALHESGSGVLFVRSYSVQNGLASDVILSLASAPGGDLWVGTPDGLSRIHTGIVTTFTSADGLPDDFIRSLLVDTDGSLWIGTRRGLAHWPAGSAVAKMQIYTHANGLGSDLVGAMTRDKHGDLWVATLAGLSRLHNGTITNYTTANGLASNVVTALLAGDTGVVGIGTRDHGWGIWYEQHFSTDERSNAARTAVHAILEDEQGPLWFATDNGIARCRLVNDAIKAECADWIEFGPADGLRSREMATNSHPSAWRSRDGLLWFTTPKGLVEVDPAHFRVNTLPPPVALERFVVDDLGQPLHGADSRTRVAAGHVHFEFDYAGLSFVAPQKVRYRYMLEGFDHGWTEAGARRTAYYTNIPPGRYTFRVQAANNDGVWNTAGAALAFELRPHFYQTLWFYILLVAAISGVLVLVIRRRLRRAEREFQAVLRERSRIAREIHDTLAQGYVGISVQLELLAELLRMSRTDAAQKQLDVTREYVREGLADARQSIWALRTEDAGETTLPVKLRRMVEAAGGDTLHARCSVFGAYRPLPAETEQELLRVAQEAIHNVKKHAAATELAVRLEYGPATIILQVQDNGRGGVVDMPDGRAAGHFGLTGMRERAAAVGGTLEVTSAAGDGTTIRLEAPAPEAVKELR